MKKRSIIYVVLTISFLTSFILNSCVDPITPDPEMMTISVHVSANKQGEEFTVNIIGSLLGTPLPKLTSIKLDDTNIDTLMVITSEKDCSFRFSGYKTFQDSTKILGRKDLKISTSTQSLFEYIIIPEKADSITSHKNNDEIPGDKDLTITWEKTAKYYYFDLNIRTPDGNKSLIQDSVVSSNNVTLSKKFLTSATQLTFYVRGFNGALFKEGQKANCIKKNMYAYITSWNNCGNNNARGVTLAIIRSQTRYPPNTAPPSIESINYQKVNDFLDRHIHL